MRALTSTATRRGLPVARISVALTLGALILGAAGGLLTRVLGDGAAPDERAAAAVALVLAIAPCWGALPLPAEGTRWAFATRVFVAGLAAVVGILVAGGGLAAASAACVPAGAVALAAGVAHVARADGVRVAGATWIGAATPLLLVGALFVADPFIEWAGPAASSTTRAAWVLRVNPLASATGAIGVDLSSRGLLYDGTGAGAEGLSVVGQYYPSRPSPALTWGGIALLIGSLLVLVSAPADRKQHGT